MRFNDEKSFIYLRYNWISTSTKLLQIALELAEACRQSRGNKRQVKTDFTPAFNAVLTSLEVSGAYTQGQWIRIVTDGEVYGGETQRSAAHHRGVLTALNWLIASGYLLMVDKRRQAKVVGSSQLHHLPFAYVITDKWRHEISDQPISVQHEVVRNPLASYVQLRKKIKTSKKAEERSVSLQITSKDRQQHPDLIEASERLLEQADDVWRHVHIHLGDIVLPAMLATMTRIFNNGSFNQGGRFYCQLQNQRKDQRIHLRFDDEPTIEIDFTGIHPHLMYHLQGDGFNGDPYGIKGFDRDTVKVAFNTLINRDGSKHKGHLATSLARNLDITQVKAMELEKALYKLHHRIAGYFNTGYGLKLQKLDSQIAYDVMTHFFMKIKRPVLMIHDSAIVSVRDVETLKLCMVDAYRSVVFNELQKISYSDEEHAPLPKGLKVTSADFNSTLTNTIVKALEGVDVLAGEWTAAMKAA
jgi:hypothetical protein